MLVKTMLLVLLLLTFALIYFNPKAGNNSWQNASRQSANLVAWVIRSIPELKISLPNNAIGKDWLCDENGFKFFALSE